jgi:isopenicillin N synthase-like dioxygenase
MSLPAIDFSAFRNGTELERKKLATRITEEFKKHGATRLTTHGISGGSTYLLFHMHLDVWRADDLTL